MKSPIQTERFGSSHLNGITKNTCPYSYIHAYNGRSACAFRVSTMQSVIQWRPLGATAHALDLKLGVYSFAPCSVSYPLTRNVPVLFVEC